MTNIIKQCAGFLLALAFALLANAVHAVNSLESSDNQLIIWEQEADSTMTESKHNFFVYMINNQQGLAMLLMLTNSAEVVSNNNNLENYRIVNWVILKQSEVDRIQSSLRVDSEVVKTF